MLSFEGVLLPSLLASLLGTVLAINWLIDRASGLGLLDEPGGRKHHARPTPLVGGLGMGVGLIAIWLLVPAMRPSTWILLGFAALLVLGAVDDRRELPALRKLVIELLVVGIALAGAGVTIRDLGMLLPGVEVSAGWLGWPLAVFGVVSVLNALNMIDGVDGLSGSVALVGFGALSVAAGLCGDASLMQAALLPCSALAGFLAFNLRVPGRSAARVFMGDAGSLSIGYLLGVYAIVICQSADVPAIVTVWAVALPLLDGLTVIQRRSARGIGVTQPGADHLHHLLKAWGFGVGQVSAIEAGLAVCLAGLGILLWQLEIEDWVSLSMLLVLALILRSASDRAWLLLERRNSNARQQAMSTLGADDADDPLALGLTGDGGSTAGADFVDDSNGDQTRS